MTSVEQGRAGTDGSGPFRLLCVCEGNICRSPVAALLLQAALGPDVEVASAGTHALVGAPMAPPMAALLGDQELGSDAFRARQLERHHLRQADLVLTMTREQRGRVATLDPAAVRRTFTLRELARLLAAVDRAALPPGTVVERLHEAVPVAGAARRYVADPRDDDIADPYGRADAAYRRAFEEIADAVRRIGAALVPRVSGTGGDREAPGQ